ncbi:MAG TPA: hypothetical protein VFU21_26555 [Kofleriaceae bacterium]|nr:hypothetical protein [Kofleriaceae bacterium]
MKKGEPSPLVAAAERLERALAAHDRAAHALVKQKLDSRRNLGKAADLLNEVAAADDALSAEVAAMVGAIAAARDRQQALAAQVHARAQEVLARTEALAPLLGAFEALAGEVRQLGESAGDGERTSATLEEVLARVSELGDRAQAFAAMAQEKDFADLAGEGHALREQLLAIQRTARRQERKKPQN